MLMGGSAPPAVVYCLAPSPRVGGEVLINRRHHFERLQQWQLLAVGSPLTASLTGTVP